MEVQILPRSLIHSWSATPIPDLKLSASGLLALADLRTVAHRTALTGGSSWLDALVLAPGLHYQQACDWLDRETPVGLMALGGADARYDIKNVVTLNYLMGLCRQGPKGLVTIDVGSVAAWQVGKRVRRVLRKRRKIADEEDDKYLDISPPNLDWVSHLLYLISPCLTVASITFMVLFEDWWGVSIILALIASRILNIWAIKHRTEPHALNPTPMMAPDRGITVYRIDLGGGHVVRLRGLDTDLQALTTQVWLRAQSHLDGYLEAAAKLIVYLVAALSGNMTQAGAIILVGLLVSSAALLGLSNAHASGFRVHGRYAVPEQVGTGDETVGTTTAVQNVDGRVRSRPVTTPPSRELGNQ
ncbi:hypothetical protein EDB81DRAFT_337228 [Dactylonectria macrodidyma]|uniref:Uncharacterized protein n=1 Tax=Dactylonectria macrodidyma TaxID=307937 RepID=A0A9P9FHU2_9HYPO|nr:hypothetical protein EDB81DRAFT_337228 [Dactylonectria macrodidyma]